MPRPPSYQHVPYVPDYERALWEVIVDYVFPPIRFPDGRRFDEDYLERLWFHAFGVGGPLAEEHNRYEPHLIWKLLDARDAVVNAYAEHRQNVRTKWEWFTGACSSRLNNVSGWLGSKSGWTTRWKPMLRRSKLVPLCGITHEDDDDDVERQYYDAMRQTPLTDDSQRYPHFGFSPSPTPPTERTCLLQHASLYSAISTMDQDEEDDAESELPIASSPPKGGKPPSALSSKRGVFRKLHIWGLKSKRPKVVRFTNRHNVLLFDKLPWEPTGCYKPDYSHLTESRPDPQIEVIVSMLHAVSSASRQSPPQSPYPAFPSYTTHVVPCES